MTQEGLVHTMRSRRFRDGLSLRQLAPVVGVSFSTLARIERGDGMPDAHTRWALLRWLAPESMPTSCGCIRCTGARTALEGRIMQLEQRVTELEHALLEMQP